MRRVSGRVLRRISKLDRGLYTFFNDVVEELHSLQLHRVREFAMGEAGDTTALVPQFLLDIGMAS